jgi:hypothetical protein
MGGIAVTMVGHPFDTIKVRLQCQSMEKPIYCECTGRIWDGVVFSGPGGGGWRGGRGGGVRVAVGAMVVVLHVACRCRGQQESQACEGCAERAIIRPG